MTEMRHTSPDQWLLQVFSAKAACKGGVVRRNSRDVDATVGRARFLGEVARRGWHAVENGDQIVVFCNAGPIRVLC